MALNGGVFLENFMQHAITWFEIPVADLTRAMAFYGAVTGRTMQREAFGLPGEEMATFTTEHEDALKGCLQLSPHAKPASVGTLVYLNAAPSLDVWLDRVEKAGGSITVPKTALPPGMGFFAHMIDSEGNRVGLHALT